MFKKTLIKCWNALKKPLLKTAVALAVLAVLTGIVIGIRMLFSNRESLRFEDASSPVVPNSELEPVEEEGMFLADESETLKLYVDCGDGNIRIENKLTGYVWSSRPSEEDMALESSNTLWKNNLCSPVVFTYATSYEPQARQSMTTKYTNTLSQETNVSVFRLEDGVRVFFEFTESNVTFAYEARLDGERLRVDVPAALISDPGEVYKVSKTGVKSLNTKESCIVIDFYVLPWLGAARSDTGTQGFMLIPDGNGALLNYQSDRYASSQYIAHIYGNDIGINNGYDSALISEIEKPQVSYPVFGVAHGSDTMLAIVEKGETQADIIASKAGTQTGFNTVNARFTYRTKYKVITNSASGSGYMRFTDFSVQEDKSTLYYFGSGGYVDMAQQYRSYLSETYDLHRIDSSEDQVALQLNIVGGDIETTTFGKRFIAMTTFDEAYEIAEYFMDAGVRSIDMVYSGWGRDGESIKYPKRFPAAGNLGGDRQLRALAKKLSERGSRLYLTEDRLDLLSHRGVSVSHDTIYNIQNNPLYSGAFANAAYIESGYSADRDEYLAYGIAGLEEEGLAGMLITDYSPRAVTSRADMKQVQRKTLAAMLEDMGSLRVDSSFDWVLMDGVMLTKLQGSSYLNLIDEHVPFYTIAIHGLVDYICGDYMEFYEPEQQLLEAVAKGGNISFTLSMQSTEKLAEADTADYYSTEFDVWKDDVLCLWNKLEPYLDATRGAFIAGHETVSPGVSLTEYSNGSVVLVNNTDEPVMIMNITVPARDFLLVNGGANYAE